MFSFNQSWFPNGADQKGSTQSPKVAVKEERPGGEDEQKSSKKDDPHFTRGANSSLCF